MGINCLTECDVLAISTFITNEIAKHVDDVDTLAFLADLITAIGETLALLASQRKRLQQNCKKKTKDPTSSSESV